MRRVQLTGLQQKEYSHPFDEEARSTLESVPGLAPLVKKVNEIGVDRLLHLGSMANRIRVTERQFPELHGLFLETCRILDISRSIDLYIEQSFALNAFASGVEYPHVVVTSELINYFSQDELRFVLAHELGHHKSEHIVYHQIGQVLPILMRVVGDVTLGLGRLLGTGVEVALYDWIRKSELSADRAGLLGCQDPDAVIRAFCKFAGVPRDWFDSVNLDEIHRQAEDFERMVASNTGSKFFTYLGQMWNTHPWIIVRFNNLLQWMNSGDYDLILGQRRKQIEMHNHLVCPSCGQRLRVPSGRGRISVSCPTCGERFRYTS